MCVCVCVCVCACVCHNHIYTSTYVYKHNKYTHIYFGIIPSEVTRWSPRMGLEFSLKLGTIIQNISNVQISNFTLIHRKLLVYRYLK